MDLIEELQPFRKGAHQLSVVTTDLAEAESLIRMLAEAEQARSPQAFAGKEACVYFKLPYIPPCDSFRELRRLILRIRQNTGLRAQYKGVVAIEVSQWLGHEKEEYFTVLLKYLYDHRSHWKLAAVLNGCTRNQVSRFLSECSRYITPRLFPVQAFTDADALCGLIQREFSRQGRPIDRDAAELMAAALGRPELKDSRSLTLIARAAEETIFLAGNSKSVTAELVRDYLLDSGSVLTMMAGKQLYEERGAMLAKESLQLRS